MESREDLSIGLAMGTGSGIKGVSPAESREKWVDRLSPRRQNPQQPGLSDS
jgi:hypothetical protein